MKKDILLKFIKQQKKANMHCVILVLFLFSPLVFAQTTEDHGEPELSAEIAPEESTPLPKSVPEESTPLPEIAPDEVATIKEKAAPSILVITVGPLGILNTQKNSAPSPILFSIGAGAQIELAKNISLVPHGHFFGSYFLWENGQVLPAEIEHRTAFVPSILVDIPVTYDFYVGKSIFRLGAGVSFLFRFAARANDVPSSEKPDIEKMNTWFWQNARFLYPSVHFSWDYVFDNGIAVGLGLKAYFSVGGFIDNGNLDQSMIALSVRLIPPAW